MRGPFALEHRVRTVEVFRDWYPAAVARYDALALFASVLFLGLLVNAWRCHDFPTHAVPWSGGYGKQCGTSAAARMDTSGVTGLGSPHHGPHGVARSGRSRNSLSLRGRESREQE